VPSGYITYKSVEILIPAHSNVDAKKPTHFLNANLLMIVINYAMKKPFILHKG